MLRFTLTSAVWVEPEFEMRGRRFVKTLLSNP